MSSSSRKQPPKDFEYSKEFEANAKKLEKDIRVLDDIMDQVEWAVRKDPTLYPFASVKADIRVIRSSSFRNYPSVSIYFKEFKNKWVFIDIFENETSSI
jgi:hypothetical protein